MLFTHRITRGEQPCRPPVMMSVGLQVDGEWLIPVWSLSAGRYCCRLAKIS